jgi:DNA-binding GntR family transcriptional regulator
MRGARVATVEDASFYEVFLIRRALAGLIIQQVVKAPSSPAKEEFVSRARALTEAAETCPDGHVFAGRIRRAIQIMQKVAHTPRTLHLIRSLTFGYLAFQDDIVATKKSRCAQAKLWLRIAKAVENGQPDAARSAMDELFDFAFEYVSDMKSARVSNISE